MPRREDHDLSLPMDYLNPFLTEALARWTASLWEPRALEREKPAPVFSIDGHRKPVYADALIPRGLIGCTRKILGCRALVPLKSSFACDDPSRGPASENWPPTYSHAL